MDFFGAVSSVKFICSCSGCAFPNPPQKPAHKASACFPLPSRSHWAGEHQWSIKQIATKTIPNGNQYVSIVSSLINTVL